MKMIENTDSEMWETSGSPGAEGEEESSPEQSNKSWIKSWSSGNYVETALRSAGQGGVGGLTFDPGVWERMTAAANVIPAERL